VLVDGAVNRITQVGALGQVQFAFTVRVDPTTLDRAVARIRSLYALAALPESPEADQHLEGPVTPAALLALPDGTTSFSAEDFTKFFLEPQELHRALDRYRCVVRRRLELLCFAVILRGVDRAEFLRALGPEAAASVFFNPFEVAS
jgi:hypothetical protein